MLKLRKNKKGFTLVELIVVIAIMAVLAGTIAGVTVSQLNKQTNNTAKSEAQSLASDLHSFMIDYKLSAPDSGNDWTAGAEINNEARLAHAVKDFLKENNQDGNIEVIIVDGTTVVLPTDNDTIKGNTNNFRAGDHKFYAFVYKESEKDSEGKDKKDSEGHVIYVYKVRFCCKQKGSGKNQFPFADYTYSDVLADN